MREAHVPLRIDDMKVEYHWVEIGGINLYLDGAYIGRLPYKTVVDQNTFSGKRSIGYLYPKSFDLEELVITLSNGAEYRVATEPLVHIPPAGSVGNRSTPKFSVRVDILGITYDFYQALRKLSVGEVLGYERRFRPDFVRRVVTNGAFDIPFNRPKSWHDKWRNISFLRQFSDEEWSTMLVAIYGLYLREILDVGIVSARVREVRCARERIRHSSELERVLKRGQFFSGEGARRVSIGENFIFTLLLHDGEEIFIVDSPKYGRGLYIFVSYEDAEAWATRRISVKEARSRALAFIPHRDGWKEHVTEVIRLIG